MSAFGSAAVGGGVMAEFTSVVIGDGESAFVAPNKRFESVRRSAIFKGGKRERKSAVV